MSGSVKDGFPTEDGFITVTIADIILGHRLFNMKEERYGVTLLLNYVYSLKRIFIACFAL